MIDTYARDQSVDFVKGMAMIAVSFGHIMPTLYGKVEGVSTYCYSFELAAFFIVSGYLQFGRPARVPLDYVKHSVLSLLYPYAMFTMVLFVYDSGLNILANGVGAYIQDLPVRISSVLTWGVGACWFFPTFFLSGLIAYFCRRDCKLPDPVKTLLLIVAGSVMCVISERYGHLKEVTRESIMTASFWEWHVFSLLSRGIIGASLIMVGCELKRFASCRVEKFNGGGVYYICCPNNYRYCNVSGQKRAY